MKKIIVFGLFSLSLFVFCSAGFAPDFKIATVDLLKVRDSYYKYILARSSVSNDLAARDLELNKMADELKKIQDQGRQSLDNPNNQALSAEARAKYQNKHRCTPPGPPDPRRIHLQLLRHHANPNAATKWSATSTNLSPKSSAS